MIYYIRLIIFGFITPFSISLYASNQNRQNEPFENQSSEVKKAINIELLKTQALKVDREGLLNKKKKLHKYQKRKFISNKTKNYHLTSYIDNCRARIFRIGNLTAPYFLGRNGRLILEVSISSDGSLDNLEVVKSSGFSVIDDSAINAVRVAAPFAKFPEDVMKQDVDVITFRQSMRYKSGYRLFYIK